MGNKDVNNEIKPDIIPVNNRLFMVYGGIYRSVSLIVTNKVHISATDFASPGVYITQDVVSEKKAEISLRIKLENNHIYQQLLLNMSLHYFLSRTTVSELKTGSILKNCLIGK